MALVLLGVAALVAALRWNARAEIDRAENERLDGQARAVQRILARQLESAYAALVGVREDAAGWTTDTVAVTASRRFKALSDAIPGLGTVALLDARGSVRAASRLTLIGADLAARLPTAGQMALSLNPPRRDAGGQMAIDLVLPLAPGQGVDGGGGAILASLDSDYFRLVMRSVLYASDMRASIAHGNGDVLMFDPPQAGNDVLNVARPGSMFQRHRDSGREDSMLAGQVLSGGDRLVALRNLRLAALDPPLVLSISRERSAVLAPWRQQTQWAAGLYGVFAAGLALALALLQQRQRAMHRLQLDAEVRQRAEAERLALALNGADLGLWDLDLRGGNSTVNARWAEMLGYAPGEVAAGQDGWRDLVHPDDRARVDETLQAHIDGRSEAYEAVYRMHHRSGHWVWILDRGKVLERAPDGTPMRMLGTHMDLTQRMQAEQALRDRERLLSTVADAVPGPVSRVDRDGRYLFANMAYERWFGVGASRIIGQTQRQLLGEQRYAHAEPFVRRALAGESVSYETPVHSTDGVQRWALVSLVPDRDAQGQVIGYFTVLYDISDRKRAEDALRHSERKTRALVENLMVGVIVHQSDSEVVEANPAACRLFGLTLEQMRGKSAVDPAWRFVEEDGRPMARERYPVSQVAASGQPLSNMVGGIVRPDLDHTVWVLCNAFPMRRADGAVENILVTALDITERRQAELERQALERQLRESQRMESIGTLAGGIAHDFNNILAAILGNVALARQDVGAGHPVQDSLAQIHKAGLRARSLVQQILAFSRRDPGVLQVQPLRGIVDETLSLLRATLPATVRLDARPADTDIAVRADATQLQQVLMNLATNAWHALPASGGRIEIGVERIAAEAAAQLPVAGLPPGPAAHLWVRDNGSGMDANTRARIFDPFFTTKPVGQGTGLGLSVVHGIVRAHQGTIAVDSAPGGGSVFHLYFPSPDGDGGANAEEAGAGAGPDGAGRHVLYVDDDEVMVLMAERLLQRAGYRVSTCSTATDALARVVADSQAFDIVVTDFNMPEMSGLELARALAPLRADLPVVLSSGLMSETLREQARQAGVRALLKKENSVEELTATVARALAHD